MSSRRQISRISGAPLGRERHSGGVVEVRDRVEELDLLAGRAGGRDRLLQRLGHQPVGVHLGVHHVALVGLEHPQRADVRRRLADHDVAGVAEDPGHEVDGLLRAHGDDHVVGVRLDALEPHHVGDLLTQHGHALAGAVLHRHRTVVGDQVADGAADDVERQARDVGHAAGERDDLGPRGDREEGADLGGGHPGRACGVPVDVGVEAVLRARRRVLHGGPSVNDHRWRRHRDGPRLGHTGHTTGLGAVRWGNVPQGRAAHAGPPRRARGAVPHLPVLAARPGQPRPGRDEEAATEKEAWVSQVLRDWGSCGRVVLVDDRPVGYVIYAPQAFCPGPGRSRPRRSRPTRCCSPTVWVHPEHAGGGLGRMLVQGMARDLIKRGGIKAVEAFGDTRGPGAAGRCVVPSDFLGSVGFKTQRAHGATPRMRMDLRTALS